MSFWLLFGLFGCWITADDLDKWEQAGGAEEDAPAVTDDGIGSETETNTNTDITTDTETNSETSTSTSTGSGTSTETSTETETGTETETETETDSSTCPPDMVLIPAQTFDMGCSTGEVECDDIEYPVHSVTLSNDYCISITEVTQDEYSLLMGNNPSDFTSCGGNCPVETVSWHDAAAYANARSAQEGLSACYSCSGGECSEVMSPYLCTGYRLPTEAEWEAAARCGENTIYTGSNNVNEVAWYSENSGNSTHVVAGKTPNACGLYDMSGSVWEWVHDWFDDYSSASQIDPTGSSSGSSRVSRGGSWNHSARNARVSYRDYTTPSYRGNDRGFRLSRTVSAQ